ncbi:MAG: PfkB family carbohydrate kinase [Candidatus Latescibacterota bacterium]|jgi:rfaE bifunctional protein kinase chain/domain
MTVPGLPDRRRAAEILEAFPGLRLAVIGDFFLDAYFDCDPALEEISLETGRPCHQVIRTRRQAGAAGTVATNLAALGVGSIEAVGFCGDDGEGYELRRAMTGLGLDLSGFFVCPERFTPTYGKPCHVDPARPGAPVTEELERLDLKNRQPTPARLQRQLLDHLMSRASAWDGAAVLDQANEAECGVLTTRVRRGVVAAARRRPRTVFLADSRERIGLFRKVCTKPNQFEAARALEEPTSTPPSRPRSRPTLTASRRHALALADRTGRPVFLTLGTRGMLVADRGSVIQVPAFAVEGPVDPVGAGDATSAALLACLAGGASLVEAAWIAAAAASITVQQLGTTGTATPAQIRRRLRELPHAS